MVNGRWCWMTTWQGLTGGCTGHKLPTKWQGQDLAPQPSEAQNIFEELDARPSKNPAFHRPLVTQECPRSWIPILSLSHLKTDGFCRLHSATNLAGCFRNITGLWSQPWPVNYPDEQRVCSGKMWDASWPANDWSMARLVPNHWLLNFPDEKGKTPGDMLRSPDVQHLCCSI